VVAGCHQLLFDRRLDSSWRRTATTYTEWADIGIGFHSPKISPNTQSNPIPASIGQYPYPNASIVRTIISLNADEDRCISYIQVVKWAGCNPKITNNATSTAYFANQLVVNYLAD